MAGTNPNRFKSFNDLDSFEKVYWYLRSLVDTNRYGAISRDPKRLVRLSENIISSYELQVTQNMDESSSMNILFSVMEQTITDKVRPSTKKYYSYLSLIDRLKLLISSKFDYLLLGLTIKNILIPTNTAVENVPTTEGTEFAKIYANALLKENKEKALATIVRDWDLYTEMISLNRERDLLNNLFKQVKETIPNELNKYNQKVTHDDLDVLLTSMCQEFERRVGQKRKKRAGDDLEGVIKFLFKNYGIKGSGGPEHFSSGIEVDNWVKDSKGWYIGISLKRTLRERWKQTYTTEIGMYDRKKIKYIIHVINNDFDLSDTKISELGSYRHKFFLADDSPKLTEFSNHIALENYVFPMSELINKIKEYIRN